MAVVLCLLLLLQLCLGFVSIFEHSFSLFSRACVKFCLNISLAFFLSFSILLMIFSKFYIFWYMSLVLDLDMESRWSSRQFSGISQLLVLNFSRLPQISGCFPGRRAQFVCPWNILWCLALGWLKIHR